MIQRRTRIGGLAPNREGRSQPHAIAALLIGSFALTSIAHLDPEPGSTPPQSESDAESSLRDHPLQPLSMFPGGEWRTVLANGNNQRDVWSWGPGMHALTSITRNKLGTSESIFGSFRVIYHHPQRDEISVLALSGADLIQTGTLTPLDNGDLRFDMTLFYDQEEITWAPEPTREIVSVWSFDSATSYANSWIKDQGQPLDPSTVSWSFTKADTQSPPPTSALDAPSAVKHLGAFLPLLESAWTSGTERTTLEWVPYNESIRMHTVDTSNDTLITETVIYPHPHTKAIHTLTIHASGAVDEGIATVDGEDILIRARRADHDSETPIERRIMLGPDSIRFTTWAINGNDRTELDETALRASSD